MNWNSLEEMLIGAKKYSTAFGRVWLSTVSIFRIFVFWVAAQRVWADEEKDFICNTAQPGCNSVCYNHLIPISHIRLWALQLIFITCPSLMVVFHVKYREMKNLRYGKHLYPHPERMHGGLWWTYLVSLIFRIGIDAGFLYIMHHIYKGYDIPRMAKCAQPPCPNTVDCYFSRPTEKKIFVLFMVVSAAVCIFMCICEIVYFIFKRYQKFIKMINRIIENQRRSEEGLKTSTIVDPTASNQSLCNKKNGNVPTKI